MIDSAAKGTGNSRYLKSVANFKALYPTYDSFVAALIAGTLPVDMNGINESGFEILGTLLNKANLFSDATAAKYPDGTETVNGALGVLGAAPVYEEASTPRYTEHSVTLSQAAEGDIVYLNEGGTAIPFYVAKHNYESGLNGTGRTLLVRGTKYGPMAWNDSDVNTYATSTIDSWLNGTYKALFSSDIRSAIPDTKFYYTPGNDNYAVTTLTRKIFLPSMTELGKSGSTINVEGTTLPVASQLVGLVNAAVTYQWSRSPRNDRNAYVMAVKYDGDTGYLAPTNANQYILPAFTLPHSYSAKWYEDEAGNVYAEQAYDILPTLKTLLGSLIRIPGSQIVGGVASCEGAYTGSGTSESNNKSSIALEFNPKLMVILYGTMVGILLPQNGVGLVFTGGSTSGCAALSGVACENGTVTWYSTSASLQMNTSGGAYKYAAVG